MAGVLGVLGGLGVLDVLGVLGMRVRVRVLAVGRAVVGWLALGRAAVGGLALGRMIGGRTSPRGVGVRTATSHSCGRVAGGGRGLLLVLVGLLLQHPCREVALSAAASHWGGRERKSRGERSERSERR